MTMSLGEAIKILRKRADILPTPLLNPEQIAVIIPVKDNQIGINRLLQSLFDHVPTALYPKAIIIVDNNSKEKIIITETHKARLKIHVDVIQCKKPGPAAARNAGVRHAEMRYEIDWLFFMDSDCLFTPDSLHHLLIPSPDSVAYQLKIIPNATDWLSSFYHEHSILKPLPVMDSEVIRPEAIITAGALVYKKAFFYTGGFPEDFPDAAGEDLFLGYKLRMAGHLAYLNDVTIRHDFTENPSAGVTPADILALVKRFYRYGKGNRLLEEKLLTVFDISSDRSTSTSMILPAKDFNRFCELYCNPELKCSTPRLDFDFLTRIINTALYYGYHGYPLRLEPQHLGYSLYRSLNLSYSTGSFLGKIYLENLIAQRNENPHARESFDRALGIVLRS